jgi:hypothetical protein
VRNPRGGLHRRRRGGCRDEGVLGDRRAGAVPVPDILRDHEGSRRPRVRPGNLIIPMPSSGVRLDCRAVSLVKIALLDFNPVGIYAR